MTEDELINRIAQTLKREIGPAVERDYPKTQAYMASVVLEKLAGQLRHAAADAAANAADHDALAADIEEMSSGPRLPRELVAAIADYDQQRDDRTLCRLIETLYLERANIGSDLFDRLLVRIRQLLRRSIDRRVAFSA